jgi:hypothetical protein
MEYQDALKAIQAVIRTKKYDTDHDLETSFMIGDRKMDADGAINQINKIAHDALTPPKTHVYGINYTVNGGFRYRVNVDAIDKASARGHLFSEFQNGERVKIQRIRRVK